MAGLLTLEDVVEITGAQRVGDPLDAAPFSSFSIDSRSVGEGPTLFIAIRGDRFDGADFVAGAFETGARAALTHRADPKAPGPQLVVPDTIEAMQRLARHWRDRFDIPIIAVTGSNGKTTTKDAIARVLGADRPTAASIGNLNSQIGMPLCLLNTLRAEHEIGVFETGMSEPGEIRRLCEILRPTIGVVTNVGAAHLEFHGTVESIYEAKSELVDALPADGHLVLNGACPYHTRMRDRFGGNVSIVTVGPDADSRRGGGPPGDVHLALETVDLDGSRGQVRVRGDDAGTVFRFPIPGEHMIVPALQAVALAAHVGIPLDRAVAPLVEVSPAPHRMQVRRGPWTILDDSYNANPPSTRAVLDFFRTLPVAGRRVAILGDMLELGPTAVEVHHELIQHAIADEGLDRLVLVGPLYREAFDGAAGLAGSSVRCCDAVDQVGDVLEEAPSAGDVILLKGSRGIALDRLLTGALAFPES